MNTDHILSPCAGVLSNDSNDIIIGILQLLLVFVGWIWAWIWGFLMIVRGLEEAPAKPDVTVEPTQETV